MASAKLRETKIHLVKKNTEEARSTTWELGLVAKSKILGIFLIHFEHSKASLLFKLFSEDLWYKTVFIYSSWKLLSWAEARSSLSCLPLLGPMFLLTSNTDYESQQLNCLFEKIDNLWTTLHHRNPCLVTGYHCPRPTSNPWCKSWKNRLMSWNHPVSSKKKN